MNKDKDGNLLGTFKPKGAVAQAEVTFGSAEKTLMTMFMPFSEAYKIVFDELIKIDLFKGIYDAKNGNEHFMHGVALVMENIATGVSDECYEKFDKEFTQNMIESEKKANDRADRKESYS